MLTELENLAARPLLTEQPIVVGKYKLSTTQALEIFSPLVRPERFEKLKIVVAGRSLQVIPVLENIYDRGNISAVMRSAEAHGFFRMHVIEPEKFKFKAANRVTKGSEKWLDLRLHRSVQSSVRELRQGGYQIFATHLDTEKSISDVDWSKPTAIVFGNEKDGVTPEMLAQCDGSFKIPMVGFSQSFNISVAAALALYHAFNERLQHGQKGGSLTEVEQQSLLANYLVRCFDNPESYVRGLS